MGACLVWLPGVLLVTPTAAAVTIHLDEQDASAAVLLHVGDRLRMDLPAAPAAGLRWKAKLLDASHLQPLGSSVRPDSDRLDAAGMQVFVWKAISAGEATIVIQYRRPAADRTIMPDRQVHVSVQIAADMSPDSPDNQATNPAETADDFSSASIGKARIYKGDLPCGDCTKIATELTLFGNSQSSTGSTAFMEKRRYLGAPGGDRTIAGTGRWTVLHGTYADPSMTVYVLAAPGGGIENLKLEGTRLVPLDNQMLPIPEEKGADYGLHLVP